MSDPSNQPTHEESFFSTQLFNPEFIRGSPFFGRRELGTRSPCHPDFRKIENRTHNSVRRNSGYWWHDPSADQGYIQATLGREQCQQNPSIRPEIQESIFSTQFSLNSVSNHESIRELETRSPVPIARNQNRSDFRVIGNRSPDRRNPATNIRRNSRYWWRDPSADLGYIQATLRGEQCRQKEILILALHCDLVLLMTEERMSPIFHLLLDASEQGKLFDSLVIKILRHQDSFLDAAFCEQGAHSITKLIRKLKRSSHASTLVSILSTRFLGLMTHHIGRNVVQACFIHFRHETNERLYELTILHCHHLARDKNGCLSLNECLGTISGEQRWRILDKIGDIAETLCDDYYGNHVLQRVMQVNRGDLNRKIIECLRSKFVHLSQRKIGSYIVEKCMEISRDCLLSVIEEIVKRPIVLAQHNFGNFVVKKALLMTKERNWINLYNDMVNSLRPHFRTLAKTKGGRCVINAIN